MATQTPHQHPIPPLQATACRVGTGATSKWQTAMPLPKEAQETLMTSLGPLVSFFFQFLFYPIPLPQATACGVGTGVTSKWQMATLLPNEAQETSMTSLGLLVGFFFSSYFTNKSF